MITEAECHQLTELQRHFRTRSLRRSTAHQAVSTSTMHNKNRQKMRHHDLPQGEAERTEMHGWSYPQHDM